MDQNEFWTIIEQTKPNLPFSLGDDRNESAQIDNLTRRLGLLSTERLVGFHRMFCVLQLRADRWDLLRAAMLIEGGCGDDGFRDFRSWLISLGQEVYEQVLLNPDSLSVIAHMDSSPGCFYPLFSSVAPDLYEQRTHDEMPDEGFPEIPERPIGEEFAFAPEVMKKRFPNLWARFSHNCP